MKTYFFYFLMFIAECSFAQLFGHKYIEIEPAKMVITYSYRFQSDSTDASSVGSTKMLLFLGDDVSKFVSRAAYINDTASRKFTSNEQVFQYQNSPETPRSGVTFQILKNYPRDKTTFIQHIPSETYRFEEKLNQFDWEIRNDTVIIGGFKAQKAVCEFGGREWIAWFSPEIPYNDGPYKFNGLPGLILRIHDSRNFFDFEMLSVNKLSPHLMIDIRDKDYIVTTKQGFFKAEDSFREDIISRASGAGMSNESQQKAAKNMAKRNNPIELKRK